MDPVTILSAAHCFYEEYDGGKDWYKGKNITVRAGVLRSEDDKKGQVINISFVTRNSESCTF